ncbi:hypothetical protein [Arthrobacter sp. RIT-PI-e]|uniref:hypothetical protein n=1 Tax=Arthrobacter sp. RIT-PI-e TaxID=1681197 RepID=UPI0006768D85|nr:hypothetical protein [Arthrobacter sp. RIT-PI-e]
MTTEAQATGPRQSTSAPVTGSRRAGRVLHAILVLCTAGSTAAHAWIALTGGHGPGFSLVMAVMSVMCLPCVLGLVRSPHSTGPVRMVLAMSLLMVLLHLLAITLGTCVTATHHLHPLSVPAPEASVDHVSGGGHLALMVPLVVLELVVAALASCRLRPSSCSSSS